MTQFITLAGKKQVGKDTSARYIQHIIEDETDRKVHITHFADVLKQACSVIFGIPLAKMETDTGKKELTDVRWPKDYSFDPTRRLDGFDDRDRFEVSAWYPNHNGPYMTVREVLQFVGTQLFRTQLDPDIWVKSVFKQQYGENDIVVIADCRFPNEAEFAKEHGLLLGVYRETDLAPDNHASETALDDYNDYDDVIINNDTFEDLRLNLIKILDSNGFLD